MHNVLAWFFGHKAGAGVAITYSKTKDADNVGSTDDSDIVNNADNTENADNLNNTDNLDKYFSTRKPFFQ